MIFVACQTMEGQPTLDIREIWNDLRPAEKQAYAERLRGRGIDRFAPAVAAAARQILFFPFSMLCIDRATAQIGVEAEAHRRRAETVDALTSDRLLFDDSPEGERLRRYELANGRAKARALNELRIREHLPLSVVSGQLSVVRGPLSVVSGSADVVTEAIAPNEPTERRENAPNEATGHWENAPNEATGHWENAPNEPTECWENAPNEPTVECCGKTRGRTKPPSTGENAPERTHRALGKCAERTHA